MAVILLMHLVLMLTWNLIVVNEITMFYCWDFFC